MIETLGRPSSQGGFTLIVLVHSIGPRERSSPLTLSKRPRRLNTIWGPLQSWGDHNILKEFFKGKVHRKKVKKKLTSVSFIYVFVAENVELLVFFLLFFAHSP